LFIVVIAFTACKSIRSNKQQGNSEAQSELNEQISPLIKGEMDSIVHADTTIIYCDYLQSPSLILKYYTKTNYNPIWLGTNGLSAMGDTLVSVIRNCYKDGLDSAQYHLADIDALCKKAFANKKITKPSRSIAHLDVLLTDAFFTYAAQQYAGCIHSPTQNVDWAQNFKSISLTDSLQKASESGQIGNILKNFVCTQPQYIALKKVLSRFLDFRNKGSWTTLPEDTHLEKGDTGARVTLLYKHLLLTGDITDNHNAANIVYDDSLAEAVKRYQTRNGLKITGKISDPEAKELNKDINERINQIELNMERMRWLPRKMPQTFVMVNIAGFNLVVVDSNKPALTMKVIAGKPYKQTPLFISTITYITLNPWWIVPESIATGEMLPAVKKDRNYLEKKNIKVYASLQPNAPEVSPSKIKWNTLTASNFRYHFRQTPGSWNSLGRYLFMFPNTYDVYLHDTPNKNLFSEQARAFSHGCMRIEKPLDLAEYLLKENTGWTKDHISEVVASDEKDVKIILKKPVDIYICYWTAWVNDNGQISFVPDIYNYDQSLNDDLHKCSPQIHRGAQP